MKRYIAVFLVLILLTVSTGAFAAYSDVSSTASYSGAVERVTQLGIMDEQSANKFNPDGYVTREQFAKIIVIAAGLSDDADMLTGPTIFSDIPANGANNGYINEAVKKGFMAGMVDGKFHPADGVTFAQVCTAMVRALGYTDQDVTGTWPGNYIAKAKAIGITNGISLKSGDKVKRSQMAIMLDKLLDTYVKKNNSAEESKTLLESSGLDLLNDYTEYSKPQVVKNYLAFNGTIGDITIDSTATIVRNTIDNTSTPAIKKIGEMISLSDIKDGDVIYKVSTKNYKKSYILVIDNKISGVIESILPNKYTPQSIQAGGTEYQLSDDFDVNKLNTSTDSFKIDDNVKLLLGYDGKVVDIKYAEDTGNSNYAVVLNASTGFSTDLATLGNKIYKVKLLMANNKVAEYQVSSDEAELKGKLVKFTTVDDTSVSLEEVSYYSNYGQVEIKKDFKKLGDDYVTDDIKIFNIVSNDDGTDVEASLFRWSDLPGGMLDQNKIMYFNKAGKFNDVNILVLNDILDQRYKMGIVQRAVPRKDGLSSYSILVDGKSYNVAFATGYGSDNVFRLRLVNGAIGTVANTVSPVESSSTVQAIDNKRIRINNVVYEFKSNISIYYKDSNNNLTRIGVDDIKENTPYGNVLVYLDKDYSAGGKVEMIVIKQ